MSNPTISIVHPTLRLKQAIKVRQAWLKAAKNPRDIQYLIGCDVSTHPEKDIVRLQEQCYYDAREHGIFWTQSECSVACNNILAKGSTGDLIAMLQDDVTMEPEPDWDLQLISKLPEGWREKELAVWIGCGIHNPDGSSLCGHHCMTRKYYERLGCFIHPAYDHYHGDDWFSYRSKHDGVVLDLRREVVWKHLQNLTFEDPLMIKNIPTSPGKNSHRIFHEFNKPAIDAGGDLPFDFVLPPV